MTKDELIAILEKATKKIKGVSKAIEHTESTRELVGDGERTWLADTIRMLLAVMIN